jgi:hypothetical protein
VTGWPARVDERALVEHRAGAAPDPTDPAAQAEPVRAVLEAVGPVLEVLAVEAELGFLERDTGLFADEVPESPVRLAATATPPGVAVRASVAQPTLERLEGPSPAAVERWLRGALASVKAPPGTVTAWRRLETRATAARLPPDAPAPELEALGPAPSRVDARGRWCAGPIDVPGVREVPPVSLRLEQDAGTVRLELRVGWTPWAQPGSAGRAALDAARAALDDLGLAPEA